MNTIRRETILIVDDIPGNLEIMANILSPDYAIMVAKSGSKALEIAQTFPALDLILLDVLMPDMDGFQTCSLLKSDPRTKAIPVIFVSTQSEVIDETRGLEVGGVDYLMKPVSPLIVRARVKTYLALSSVTRELTLQIEALQENARRDFPTARKGKLQKIEEALSTQDLEKARTLIHTLKGLAGNLSISGLVQAAGTLEKALREPDWVESARLFEIFQAAFRRFSQAIEALNLSPEDGPGSSSGTHLKTIPLPQPQELLRELKTMLIGNDPQACQRLTAFRAGFECPVDCVSDFDHLKTAIEQFEFDLALKILVSIESKLKLIG